MFKRTAEIVLKRFAQIYPIIGITGPRQSGKTTLAKTCFASLPYVSLENLDVRLRAQQDPRGFLAQYQDGAIFDEIQHVPQLLSYLQEMVDISKRMGRYVITGSQQFSLNEKITQSLAGRIGMITLLPLSLVELELPTDINKIILQGEYPGLYDRGMLPTEFYPSYIQTYIERDVRQIQNIEDLSKFKFFIQLCAGRVGQVVNFTALAEDCGITHTTARKWLSVLQASYIVFMLQPFYKNFNKRLIKMPKIYFYDTGLACNLLGLENETQLQTHYHRGALFENLVILEILKGRLNQGLEPHLYFWRDQTGHEIDLIAEWGNSAKAIEIKAGSTFDPRFLKNVDYFKQLNPEAKGCLIYNGILAGTFKDNALIPVVLQQQDKKIGLFKQLQTNE